MPRFFVRTSQIDDECVTLLGDDAHHVSRSLRMAVGEEITVCDGEGKDYTCLLESFLPDRVIARVISSAPSHAEPPYLAEVYQALPKGDKLDSIIQKAVECGATRIIPFESDRCVVRVKADAEEKKTERRRRIAQEAAKQCGRGVLPTVGETLSFDAALASAASATLALFCYEGEGTEPLPRLLDARRTTLFSGDTPPRIAILIGSEGGFSSTEVESAKSHGMLPVGLGPRILRTETAASFVLAALSYAFEL